MLKEKYITSSCVISKNVVYKNEKPVFENKMVDPSDFLIAAYHHFDLKYPRFYKMDNLSKLGFLGVEVLLRQTFSAENYRPEEIGVVLANASASLDTDIKYYETVNNIASPALFVYTLPNIMIGEICIKHNFKGETAFFVFKQFDATFMEQYANNLLDNNILQACVCGWVEFLEDEYKAMLLLVEKENVSSPEPLKKLLFTNENINKIYQLENG